MAEDFGKPKEVNPNDLRRTLDHALQYGTAAELQSLFENGMDINQEDFQGRTALQIVSYQGDIEAVKMLLEKGADVNRVFMYQGRIPMTALDAAQQARKTEIANILTEHGAKTGKEAQNE